METPKDPRGELTNVVAHRCNRPYCCIPVEGGFLPCDGSCIPSAEGTRDH